MPEENLTTINVSDDVLEVLQSIKYRKKLKRLNDVIKLILSKYKG